MQRTVGAEWAILFHAVLHHQNHKRDDYANEEEVANNIDPPKH